MDLERLSALARALLIIQEPDGRSDPWVWEHSERIERLTRWIARQRDLASRTIDHDALAAAALFHDAGWVVQFRQGQLSRLQLLGRPTSDIQRELGAAFLTEHAGHLIAGASLDRARSAIRQCNDRGTTSIEGRILADAENLDDVGAIQILKQARHYACEGRAVEQMLGVWARQHEYQYWDTRLKDFFHHESVRELARARLAAADRFMSALLAEHRGEDVRRIAEAAGAARPA